MTRRHDEAEGLPGELIDEGTTGELLQDKNAAEDMLRADTDSDASNVNDLPGFDDGRLGGHDYEDRQGEPNDTSGDNDLSGEEEGGDGTRSNGGVDGGPARKVPLPGDRR